MEENNRRGPKRRPPNDDEILCRFCQKRVKVLRGLTLHLKNSKQCRLAQERYNENPHFVYGGARQVPGVAQLNSLVDAIRDQEMAHRRPVNTDSSDSVVTGPAVPLTAAAIASAFLMDVVAQQNEGAEEGVPHNHDEFNRHVNEDDDGGMIPDMDEDSNQQDKRLEDTSEVLYSSTDYQPVPLHIFGSFATSTNNSPETNSMVTFPDAVTWRQDDRDSSQLMQDDTASQLTFEDLDTVFDDLPREGEPALDSHVPRRLATNLVNHSNLVTQLPVWQIDANAVCSNILTAEECGITRHQHTTPTARVKALLRLAIIQQSSADPHRAFADTLSWGVTLADDGLMQHSVSGKNQLRRTLRPTFMRQLLKEFPQPEYYWQTVPLESQGNKDKLNGRVWLSSPEDRMRGDVKLNTIDRAMRESVHVPVGDFSAQVKDLLLNSGLFANLNNLVVNRSNIPNSLFQPYQCGADERLNEILSGSWYKATIRRMKLGPNDFVLVIIGYADKTGTDKYQRYGLEPFTWTTALLNLRTRQLDEAWRCLSYIPDQELRSSAEKARDRSKKSKGSSCRNYQNTLRPIVEQIAKYEREGIQVLLNLGGHVKSVIIRPVLAMVQGDIKSADSFCGRYATHDKKTPRQSHTCWATYNQLDDPDHQCRFIQTWQLRLPVLLSFADSLLVADDRPPALDDNSVSSIESSVDDLAEIDFANGGDNDDINVNEEDDNDSSDRLEENEGGDEEAASDGDEGDNDDDIVEGEEDDDDGAGGDEEEETEQGGDEEEETEQQHASLSKRELTKLALNYKWSSGDEPPYKPKVDAKHDFLRQHPFLTKEFPPVSQDDDGTDQLSPETLKDMFIHLQVTYNSNVKEQALLKEIGQYESLLAMDLLPFGGDIHGIFGATPTDVMHALLLGIMKYNAQIVIGMMKPQYRAKIDALATDVIATQKQAERHFMPRTDWTHNLTQLTNLTAYEWAGKTLALVIVLSTVEGGDAFNKSKPKYQTYVEKQEGRRKPELWQSGLEDIINNCELLLCFHAWLSFGPFWQPGDVEKKDAAENAIRTMLRMLLRHTPKLLGNGYCIVKFHNMLHICRDIERFGCPMGFDAGCGERLLKKKAKEPAKNAPKMGYAKFLIGVVNRFREASCIQAAKRAWLPDWNHQRHTYVPDEDTEGRDVPNEEELDETESLTPSINEDQEDDVSRGDDEMKVKVWQSTVILTHLGSGKFSLDYRETLPVGGEMQKQDKLINAMIHTHLVNFLNAKVDAAAIKLPRGVYRFFVTGYSEVTLQRRTEKGWQGPEHSLGPHVRFDKLTSKGMPLRCHKDYRSGGPWYDWFVYKPETWLNVKGDSKLDGIPCRLLLLCKAQLAPYKEDDRIPDSENGVARLSLVDGGTSLVDTLCTKLGPFAICHPAARCEVEGGTVITERWRMEWNVAVTPAGGGKGPFKVARLRAVPLAKIIDRVCCFSYTRKLLLDPFDAADVTRNRDGKEFVCVVLDRERFWSSQFVDLE